MERKKDHLTDIYQRPKLPEWPYPYPVPVIESDIRRILEDIMNRLTLIEKRLERIEKLLEEKKLAK